MQGAVHPNLAIVDKLDINDLDRCADIFANDFVWHYFNPKWPELQGNYRGVTGLKDFFAKLNESSNGAIHVNPVDARAIGDELVVVHACNRIALGLLDNGTIEFDAIVVWRIVDGKIAEAWDIPAVHSVRTSPRGHGN